MPSIFSRIVSGDLPCYKVAETENCLAFLDVFPLVEGHILVIPKKEVDNIFDLDDSLFAELHQFSKKVAIIQKEVIPCIRIGTAVIGLEVPHAHIHLLPLNQVDDINFSKPKLEIEHNDLAILAKKLAEQYLKTYRN